MSTLISTTTEGGHSDVFFESLLHLVDSDVMTGEAVCVFHKNSLKRLLTFDLWQLTPFAATPALVSSQQQWPLYPGSSYTLAPLAPDHCSSIDLSVSSIFLRQWRNAMKLISYS